MLGGLYGDLPPPLSAPSADEEKSSNSAVWSSSTKMAPPTLRKPSSLFTPPHSVLKNQQSQNKPKAITSSQTRNVISSTNSLGLSDEGMKSPSFQPALVGVTSTVIEEYDPARPNDYEEYRKERKRRVMEAEMKRDLERRRKEEEEREREREQRERETLERERERDYNDSRASSLNISGEEAWKRRAAMSGNLGGSAPRSTSPPPNGDGFSIGKSGSGLGVGAGGQMTAAQRMMAKMGWKQGQGLGKQEQGITTPLMAKKTDRRAGVIVNASESKAEKKSVNFHGIPTRVLLLRNMVGPGEVDDDLEDEVASECSKYGTVTKCLIFEITEPNFPPDEAVRMFVQFERPEETTKALVDLDGRYFGGRVVHATFYDEERFGRNELAPMPGEIPGYS
ncbi:hypothetical protein NE237_031458 [Protea cynaroides]|uniref:Uncharacterized protein n=1 Tax=Protea cynaroides TaxID=273540 RepID=A0A9Q0L1L9_9MAGN|nr:hypothetical protein NE237_031458 [Protea cynaroides]